MVLAEQDSIRVDHAKIGALLCRKWKLPKLLGDAVLSHHFYEADKTPAGGIKTILQVINLSSLFVSVLLEDEGTDLREQLDQRAREFFGFGDDTINELLGMILEPARHVGEAFSIEIAPGAKVEAAPKAEEVSAEPIACPKCDAKNPPAGKVLQQLWECPEGESSGADRIASWWPKIRSPAGARSVSSSRNLATSLSRRRTATKHTTSRGKSRPG